MELWRAWGQGALHQPPGTLWRGPGPEVIMMVVVVMVIISPVPTTPHSTHAEPSGWGGVLQAPTGHSDLRSSSFSPSCLVCTRTLDSARIETPLCHQHSVHFLTNGKRGRGLEEKEVTEEKSERPHPRDLEMGSSEPWRKHQGQRPPRKAPSVSHGSYRFWLHLERKAARVLWYFQAHIMHVWVQKGGDPGQGTSQASAPLQHTTK